MKSFTLATALSLAGFTHGLPVETISSRASGSSYTSGANANDIVNGVCAPLTFIFARGSTETGNIGTVVGPGMCQNLIKDLGASGVACQGVEYAASIEGNISLGSDGGPAMAKLAKQALSQCPDTKLALSGYSQGSMVVHNAVAQQGLSVDNVAAVVLFGDPLLGQSVGSVPSSKLKEYCATGDGVCETHSFTITPAHLSYGSDTAEAAKWIVSTSGASSDSNSSSSNASRSSNDTATSTTSSGSSSVSGAADSSASASGSTSTSGSSGLGGLGALSGLGSGSLPTGLGSLGGSSSSGLGSLSSLGGSGSALSLPTGLPSLGGSSSSGSSGLGSLGSGGLGSLGGLGSSSGSSGTGGLSGLGGLGGFGGDQKELGL